MAVPAENASWPCRAPFTWLPDLQDLGVHPLPAHPSFPPSALVSPEPFAAGKAALLLEKLSHSGRKPLGLTCRGEQRKNQNKERVTKRLLHDMWTHWLLLILVTMGSSRHSLLSPSSLPPTRLQLILLPVARGLCLKLTFNRLKTIQ